ncbi:MAG: hypothetical protein WCF84_06685 [Anaerolineae bacterium]
MKPFSLILLALVVLFAAGCTTTPTPPQPATTPTNTTATNAIPTNTPAPSSTALPSSSSTPNALGMVFVAQYDPTSQVLTIYGTTPGATIIYNGTPLVPPPTPTPTNTPLPTDTPTITNTPPPVVVAPRPPPPPAAPQASQGALRGKIMFKSSRDGGFYPNSFSFYVMNPDGSGVQKLEQKSAQALYISLQGREGFSPDSQRVVLGERACYGSYSTCSLYILDTVLDARLINSNDDISHGEWISNKGFQAKDPVWSPGGNYIAFVSNHESGVGCIRSMNLFKGTPGQNPTIRRLTDQGDFCAGADAGHPSFSPNGAQVAFWGGGSGLKQIYVVDVGPDDGFDFRMTNPHIISNHQSDDWDPLWVK